MILCASAGPGRECRTLPHTCYSVAQLDAAVDTPEPCSKISVSREPQGRHIQEGRALHLSPDGVALQSLQGPCLPLAARGQQPIAFTWLLRATRPLPRGRSRGHAGCAGLSCSDKHDFRHGCGSSELWASIIRASAAKRPGLQSLMVLRECVSVITTHCCERPCEARTASSPYTLVGLLRVLGRVNGRCARSMGVSARPFAC